MDDKTPKNCSEKETVMLDGGERTTYEGGAQREPHKGKGRYDWITPFGLERLRLVSLELMKWCDQRDVSLGAAGELSKAAYFINEWRCGKRNRDYLALAAWMTMSAMHFEATGELMKIGYGFLTMSPFALERLAKWYEKGGEKYNKDGVERNWERGMLYDHPLDSALRHINCWRKGLKEEDNLAAVLWNLFALIHYEECGMDKFDNIPRYLEARWRKDEIAMAERKAMVEKALERFRSDECDNRPKKIQKITISEYDARYLLAEAYYQGLVPTNCLLDISNDKASSIQVQKESTGDYRLWLGDKKLCTLYGNTTEKYLKTQGYLPDEKSEPWTIVEDFDGTLCKGAWPEIGEPNWEEIAYILKRQKEGAKIILATCREDERLDAAVAWCAEKGIMFDAVNENLPEHCTQFGGNSRKIYGDEYRDDKAVRVTFGEPVRTYDYKALLKPEERDDLKNAKQFLDEMKREDRESDRFMLIWARRIVEVQTETIDRLTEEPK